MKKRKTVYQKVWYRGFEGVVQGVRVNTFKFLNALKAEHSHTETLWEQSIAGEPPVKRRKYQDCAARITENQNTPLQTHK